MTKMRQWTLLTVLAAVVILIGGYLLLVKPKSDEAAELRASAEQQRLANTRLQSEITRLNKQAEDLPRQQARLAAFAQRIPSSPALPTLIRALTDAADSAGIELVSLTPALPTLLSAPTTTAASGQPAARTAAGPAEPLYSIPVQLQVLGGYVQVQQFFSNLEDLSRSFQVSQFTVSHSEDAVGELSSSISGRVFMTLPGAAPAPAAPAPTPSPAGSAASPSPSPTPAQ